MTINIRLPEQPAPDLKPKITVIGVGGAGGNAVNNMIESSLEGVEFVVANTDAQALALSKADRRIQLGVGITAGLGAGARPDVGRAAAEEAMADIEQHLAGSNMVFVAAGMGGGTGTGAAPVIAQMARETNILTVGVVTKPFTFEGSQRMRIAEAGIEEMQQYVDTLIIIPNQNLFRVANEKTTFADAFKMADEVLHAGVRGVTDLMVRPGLINLDFADIRSVMSEMGKAMMGTGEAAGDKRATDAAEAAICNPLLEDTSVKGAKGVLINITGGNDMTLFEVDEAANHIRDQVDPEAHIIFGSTFDEAMNGTMRVSVVATGIEAEAASRPAPRVHEVTEAKAEPKPAAPGPAAKPRTAAQGGGAATVVRMGQQSHQPAQQPRSAPAAAAATARARPLSAEAPALKQPVQMPEPAQPEAESAEADVDTDAFIPSKPVSVEGGDHAGAPDPYAAAAMQNGGQQPARKKERGLSLFERVTGRGARASEEEDTSPAQPAPRQHPLRQAGSSASQQGLGGLTPGERPVASQHEDDLLEIPSFLRRQAN